MTNPVFMRVCGWCEQERTTNEQKMAQQDNANEQNRTLSSVRCSRSRRGER